jgi:hypothetical protein
MRVGPNTRSDWQTALNHKTVSDLGRKLKLLSRYLTIIKPGQQRGRLRLHGQTQDDYEWVRVVNGAAKTAYNVPKGMSIKH